MNFKQFKPSSWSIDNKTAIYIVTIIISIWGIMSYNNLLKESFLDIVVPKFLFMILVKISSKTLDYSLLRGTKEILYIPLSRAEKTQGKGIIDIFF